MAIVLKSLSVLLGLFFVFVGFIKLSSYISKELHKELRREYVAYAKVFPFSETLEFKIHSKWYRKTVGYSEIICGLAMAFFPNHKVKNGANICLLVLTIISVYSHFMVADKLERSAPALVFLFMLCGRLVVYYQLSRRSANIQEPTTNGCKQE